MDGLSKRSTLTTKQRKLHSIHMFQSYEVRSNHHIHRSWHPSCLQAAPPLCGDPTKTTPCLQQEEYVVVLFAWCECRFYDSDPSQSTTHPNACHFALLFGAVLRAPDCGRLLGLLANLVAMQCSTATASTNKHVDLTMTLQLWPQPRQRM